MSDDTTPEWWPLLMKEYEYHRTGIDKFDSQRLQIRNWAITLTGAIFAISFSADMPLISCGAIFTTLLFGFLEMIYLTMQVGVIKRSNHLERLVNHYRKNGVLPEEYQFGVSYAYRENFHLRRGITVVFRRGRLHVTAFYAALMSVTIMGALFANIR